MLRLAEQIVLHSGLQKVFSPVVVLKRTKARSNLHASGSQYIRGGAFEIITLQNSFHGRTLAAMSASGKPQWQNLFEPKVPGFTKVPINDLAAIHEAINCNTVAVMLEPIQGEAGVVPADVEYLQGLRIRRHEFY